MLNKFGYPRREDDPNHLGLAVVTLAQIRWLRVDPGAWPGPVPPLLLKGIDPDVEIAWSPARDGAEPFGWLSMGGEGCVLLKGDSPADVLLNYLEIMATTEPGPRSMSHLLVHVLSEGLAPLVNEGVIDYRRARERANNQACALMGVVTFHPRRDIHGR